MHMLPVDQASSEGDTLSKEANSELSVVTAELLNIHRDVIASHGMELGRLPKGERRDIQEALPTFLFEYYYQNDCSFYEIAKSVNACVTQGDGGSIRSVGPQTVMFGKRFVAPENRQVDELFRAFCEKVDSLIAEIKTIQDPGQKFRYMNGLMGYVANGIVGIHPFYNFENNANGNGRTARAMMSYVQYFFMKEIGMDVRTSTYNYSIGAGIIDDRDTVSMVSLNRDKSTDLLMEIFPYDREDPDRNPRKVADKETAPGLNLYQYYLEENFRRKYIEAVNLWTLDPRNRSPFSDKLFSQVELRPRFFHSRQRYNRLAGYIDAMNNSLGRDDLNNGIN